MGTNERPGGTFWQQQSPIDIVDAVHADGLLPLRVRYPAEVRGAFERRTKPGYSFVLDPDQSAYLHFAAQDCPLEKIHLHVRSEHRLAGKDFEMEIHLVHSIPDPQWGSSKVVLAVFVESGSKPTSPIVAHLARAHAKAGKADSVNPNHCVPKDRAFYRYEGSLTTPPFDEVVSWVVLRTPLQVLARDLAPLARRAKHEARPLQPQQRRFVLRNF